MAYNMCSAPFIHAIETEYREVKFTDDDVTNHMDWAHDAERYADALMATGKASDFVQSVMANRTRYHSLSRGQYRALMNMVRAEVLAAEKEADQLIAQIESGVEPLNLRALVSGHYGVRAEDGHAIFYQIDNITDKTNKWFGWVFVKQVLGGDNVIRTGSQRPNQNYHGQHEDHLRTILKDPLTAAQIYGLETGHCGICGRLLTEELSVESGIGPICAKRLGIERESSITKALKILKR